MPDLPARDAGPHLVRGPSLLLPGVPAILWFDQTAETEASATMPAVWDPTPGQTGGRPLLLGPVPPEGPLLPASGPAPDQAALSLRRTTQERSL